MLNAIRSLFAEKRLRCTAQRTEVYAALKSTTSHPTAEQLHRMVNDRAPGTSLATIYNTLDALCAAGLARRIPTSGGVARFDADLTEHMHAVTSDGQVIDVPHDLGAEVLTALSPDVCKRLKDRLGVEVRHVSIQLAD